MGANGSGKSTFLRILTGDELPSEGTINMPKRLKLGVLKQDHFRYEKVPILDVAMMGHAEVWQAMTEKEALLAKAEESFQRYALPVLGARGDLAYYRLPSTSPAHASLSFAKKLAAWRAVLGSCG